MQAIFHLFITVSVLFILASANLIYDEDEFLAERLSEINTSLADLLKSSDYNLHHFMLDKHALPSWAMCHVEYEKKVKADEKRIKEIQEKLELKSQNFFKCLQDDIETLEEPQSRNPGMSMQELKVIRRRTVQVYPGGLTASEQSAKEMAIAETELGEHTFRLQEFLSTITPIDKAAFRVKFNKLIRERLDVLKRIRMREVQKLAN